MKQKTRKIGMIKSNSKPVPLLPDEVKTPLDYIEYLYLIHGKKVTKRTIKAQENAVKKMIKAFGYDKIERFEIGLEGADFANNGITFVIKARKN